MDHWNDMKKEENKLSGKKVIFVGDSIMAQDGKTYEYPSAKYNIDSIGNTCVGYPSILKDRLGIVNINNIAVGGQGVKGQMEIALRTDFTHADIVIIALGTNDFSANIPIGTIPDTHLKEYPDTFIGNYCRMLDYIYSSRPTVKTVLMTPTHRNTFGRVNPGPVNDISTIGQNGHRLSDYAEAIKKIGAFYSSVVADMYSESGLNRYNLPLFTFDGVHPTDSGYNYIVKVLLKAMDNLF